MCGIKQVADEIWLVSFMEYNPGFFDDETCRLGSAENPFGAEVLPMSPVQTVTPVSGMDPQPPGAPGRTREQPSAAKACPAKLGRNLRRTV